MNKKNIDKYYCETDYQTWHLEGSKGISYNESFTRFPYRKMVWEWEKETLRNIIQRLNLNTPETKYLDFACGTGRILNYLEKNSLNGYGIDVSASMVNIARRNNQHAKLVLGNIIEGRLFPKSYFDLITAFRFFLNAQNDLRESVLYALEEIIKKDGILIINVHFNKGCLLEKEIRLYQRIRGIQDPYFTSLGIYEMTELLLKHHFEVREIYHYGVIPIYREDHKLLLNQINRFEHLLSRMKFLRHLSRYTIYVCQYRSVLTTNWHEDNTTFFD